MEELNSASDFFLNSLSAFGNSIGESLPGIVMAIVIFFLGWLLAKVVSWVFLRLLNRVHFDKLAEKIEADEFMKNANLSSSPSELVSKFIYWVLMLFVFITVSDMLGWEKVSDQISNLLSYLPNLFFAIVFFIIGTYIASFIRNLIQGATSTIGLSTGRMIANVVFYFLMAIVTITTLDQAGLDTTMISSNMLIIIGAILLAAAVSYSIASIEFVKNIIAGFYSRKLFFVGQEIEVDGERGEIKDINSLSVVLQKDNGEEVLIPTNILVNTKVKIIKK